MIHVENKMVFTLPFAQHKYCQETYFISWLNKYQKYAQNMRKKTGEKLEKNHIRHEVETGCNQKEGV